MKTGKLRGPWEDPGFEEAELSINESDFGRAVHHFHLDEPDFATEVERQLRMFDWPEIDLVAILSEN